MSESIPSHGRAHVSRRLLGLALDWVLSLLISAAFFPAAQFAGEDLTVVERVLVTGHPMATLAIFALQHLVLVATLGTTIGHRLVGVRVVREDGASPVGLLKALARTVLLLMVLPAVVWDEEGRGLHDRGAGTMIILRGDGRG
ncbi:MAG: RDD family protein [Demequina sp.]